MAIPTVSCSLSNISKSLTNPNRVSDHKTCDVIYKYFFKENQIMQL
jgi:hypothetical protein